MWTRRLMLGLALLALPLGGIAPGATSDSLARAGIEATDWIADSSDHICGLSSLRSLSDPAKVDYPKLWEATPEIKKLKEDDIDPASAEGIRLQQEATNRIHKACKDVRESLGNCSVWKAIKHEDGRTIPDITKKVLAKFPA